MSTRTRPRPSREASGDPPRAPRPPSKAQLKFAADLGFGFTAATPRWEVSRAITKEVRKRGRRVLKQFGGLKKFDLLQHPRYGLCEVSRVGEQTCKVTLLVVDEDRKVVVDAMNLAGCEHTRP